MPGKRVKVGHIGALPNANDIGPYRNIIIHTGVNNLNNFRHRQSNNTLIKELEEKINSYLHVHPKASIYVSLLIPSRSTSLNHRIRDFNNLLLDLTCRLSRVSIIENSIFGNILSDEHGRWTSRGIDTNVYEPNVDDNLHLGKHGIRLLAMNFKKCILKKKPQSRERFSAGQGQYRRAVTRGRGGSRGAVEGGASTASSRGLPQTGGAGRSLHRGGHNENRFASLDGYRDD